MSERPTIRLVAIDLDGTLLNDSKQVTEQTLMALRSLPARGVKVVIASARPPRSVRPFHALLGLDTLQINYNGAMVWDEAHQKLLYHCPMTPATVRRIVAHARERFDDVLVSCEILDKWYTDRFDQTYTTETGRLFKPDVIAPLETFCNQPITKLMLLGDPAIVQHLQDHVLPAYAALVAVVRCDPELIQIMDFRASKASALRLVAGHYGIPMEHVLAIGDAPNDIEMLQAAGVSVAMENAHEVVKQVADWVAPSNNNHGVEAALWKYGLCD